MQVTNRSPRLLSPVRPIFVRLTLVLALSLNMMPVGHFTAAPDFVALVLAFWCVREAHLVSLGTGFVLGVVVDVAHSAVMGQHALAYVLLAHAANINARRLLWFSPGEQALHMAPLFLALQVLMLAIRLLAGASFPGWDYFFSSFTTAVLWLPAHYLLLMPQMLPVERDDNRPL